MTAFQPLHTTRLVLRQMELDDLDGFVERRNGEEVARFLDWEQPFTREAGLRLVEGAMGMDGPTAGEWWVGTLQREGRPVGDMAIHLSADSKVAEVGYMLARSEWGKGYATEAVERVVDYLFDDLRVGRVEAKVHPENTASARVLERCGFIYEGTTRASHWQGESSSDDAVFAMLPEDRSEWRERPRHQPNVELVEIGPDNYREVMNLRTHWTQKAFVAPVGRTIAAASYPEIVDGRPVVPWLRAIKADDELVGVVLLALADDERGRTYLWRLLVDRLHQGRGIGRMVLDEVVRICRRRGDAALMTSWVPGRGSPDGFYLRYGFTPTGEMNDDEMEAVFELG